MKAFFKGIKKSILGDLAAANKQINIAVAWFTNHEFYDVLLRKLKEGVDVNLIIINDAINNREGGLDWQHFIKCGGHLHFSKYPGIMHHKFCVIDNRILYNGSYNWTYFAERINRENTIRHENDTKLIAAFQHEFMSLTTRNKKYLRVKRHSLTDWLKLACGEAYKHGFVVELQGNVKSLIKKKQFELANAVITAGINSKLINDNLRLYELRVMVDVAKKALLKKELLNTTINQELKALGDKKRRFEVQLQDAKDDNRRKIINQNDPRARSKYYDLTAQERLLHSLKREKLHGDFGELRINLKWETLDDLDLHVFDPFGNQIYYGEKEVISKGVKGVLDIDANATDPPRRDPQENIFWKNIPHSGRYKLVVNHYGFNEFKEVPFVLTIISQKGKSKIIFAKVHHENSRAILVAEIDYLRGYGVKEIKEVKVKTTI